MEGDRTGRRERRLNMQLMGYWQSLRDERDYVTPEEFDPVPLGELWNNCFLVNAVKNPNEMIFQHLGKQIAVVSKVPADLWNASQVPEKTLLAAILEAVPEVLEARHPIVSGGEFEDYLGRRCLYRGILLPLGEDRQSIQCLVGGGRCKCFGGGD